MNTDLFQLAFIVLVVIGLTKPMGQYLSQVMNYRAKTFMDPFLRPIEQRLYRFFKINPKTEVDWKEYLKQLLIFSLVSIIFTYGLLALQTHLPLNPQKLGAITPDLNLNTSVSFVTNTNWQNYGGESTMSYLSQAVALTLQNFLSPAVGLCVAACFVRGLARSSSKVIGNFWVDLTRVTLYLLLPLAVIFALFFMFSGCPQNFSAYTNVTTLEGGTQTIVQGPIASQEAIKMLGSNGGGYTNVNSAHPYENPTPFSNLLQIIAMFLIPSSQLYYLGKEVGNKKHGWTLFSSMMIVFIAGFLICHKYEMKGNPNFAKMGVSSVANMEGKEMRFGITGSSLFATTTTAISTGAVNCSHDSLTPIGGMIPFINMQLGEVIFGGVGSGLYGALIFVVMTVFIAGLIVGRTPEYLGKRIEAYDVKAAIFSLFPFLVSILGFTSLASISAWGKSAMGNSSAHGFSEILYAFTSTTANNGSAFAGLSANTPLWNIFLSIAMIFGRFLVIIPTMALAGSMARKKRLAEGVGSFPVSGITFMLLFIGVILLVGVLTFLPALVMGPFIEQFFMNALKLF